MIERKDIEKLATLSRITIPEEQMDKVAKDIGTILAYLDQIKEITPAQTDADRGADFATKNFNVGVKNVMREDSEPHESGLYTEKLLKSAPKSQDGYIEVKKILG